MKKLFSLISSAVLAATAFALPLFAFGARVSISCERPAAWTFTVNESFADGVTEATILLYAGKKVTLNAVLQKELIKRLMDSAVRMGSGRAAREWPAPAVPPAFE